MKHAHPQQAVNIDRHEAAKLVMGEQGFWNRTATQEIVAKVDSRTGVLGRADGHQVADADRAAGENFAMDAAAHVGLERVA